MTRRLRSKLCATSLPRPISAVIFDFDGVFTDNKVYVFEDGSEAVVCNRSDGYGISLLRKTNIPILVLSTEKNPVVSIRCRKLSIECLQGIQDKLPTLKQWLTTRQLDPTHAIYVGNDSNDLACMNFVGFPLAVSDAFHEVKTAAKLVLKSKGGAGAVREVCDAIVYVVDRTSGQQ